MPFYNLTLKAENPNAPRPVTDPRTLGEHLEKRRAELGVSWVEVAKLLKANYSNVLAWRRGKVEPAYRKWPLILEFLGYDPLPKGDTIPERVRAYRRRSGLSWKDLAREIGVDAGMLWYVGTGKITKGGVFERVSKFLEEN